MCWFSSTKKKYFFLCESLQRYFSYALLIILLIPSLLNSSEEMPQISQENPRLIQQENNSIKWLINSFRFSIIRYVYHFYLIKFIFFIFKFSYIDFLIIINTYKIEALFFFCFIFIFHISTIGRVNLPTT